MSDVRVRKLQEYIKQEISAMISNGLKDPRIGFVTVTDVEVTGDLRQAKVYFSFYGTPEEQETSYRALRHAAGHIRSEIGRHINLRYMPELDFLKDKSLDYSMHIESLLHQVEPDLKRTYDEEEEK